MAINRANVAAQIMEHLCTCAEHGYSQTARYGSGAGYCNVKTDAGYIQVAKGDRDCSSAICEAWELALKGTKWEGQISRYKTCYHMKKMFLATGLFTWEPVSANASRGDVYLDEDKHTAMALGNGKLGHFASSESGGISGKAGDQTGYESRIQAYYRGTWDGVLHYNGGADSGGSGSSSDGSSGVSQATIDDLAKRVIDGEFGNGEARKKALGKYYDAVQKRVNEMLSGKASSSTSVDIDALAKRVINGEFGNGEARKKALGKYYDAVQKRVNELLRK